MKTLAVIIALGSSAACAQDWQFAGDSPDINFFGNIPRKETAPDGSVKMWFKGIPKPGFKDLPINSQDPKSKRFTELMQYLRFRCAERQLATISLIYRDRAGNIIQSQQGSEYAVSPIIPDSVGDSLHDFACNQR